MLTGQLPFKGEHEQVMLYSIIHEKPQPITGLRSDLPLELERIVLTCLAKKSSERYQTILDLQAHLKQLEAGGGVSSLQKLQWKTVVPTAKKLRKKKRAIWAITFSTLTIIGVFLFYFFKPFSKPSLPSMKTIPFTSFPDMEADPAFSPDGKQIAFRWKGDIYVQLIGTDTPLQITKSQEYDFLPSWSPDGRYIAFGRKYTDTSGAIIMMPALGGTERKLHAVKFDFNVKAPNLSWSPDGKWFAFSESDSSQYPWSIFLLAAESLEKRKLTTSKIILGINFAPFHRIPKSWRLSASLVL
jgi:serine/threonine protein kinase